MAKVDINAFKEVADKANLKEVKPVDNEVQRYVMVYDVPTEWLNALKRNKLKNSQYFKQAVLEKLQRDGMI